MATTKQRGPGAPRREDSRPGLIRALKVRETHTETLTVESLLEVTAAKKKLHQSWSRATTTVRHDWPNRKFEHRTMADVQDGLIIVSMSVRRVA